MKKDINLKVKTKVSFRSVKNKKPIKKEKGEK